MKVLVVDDMRSELMAIGGYIKSASHEVITATNGAQALQLFETEHPDLVLLDVVMSGMDGYELARRIRALSETEWIPIIFLSGRISDADIARGIEVGGDDYLTKPVSRIVLMAKFQAMERIVAMRQRLVDVTAKLELANRELQLLANQDGLTGIANRRHFDTYLIREWERAIRIGNPLSLLIADVDYFKAYNDHYGHQHGDECLKKIAQVFYSSVRKSIDL